MTAILALQFATFLALGGLFVAAGQWRLGLAQFLPALVQAVIYLGADGLNLCRNFPRKRR